MIPIVQPTLHNFDEVVREFRQAWESGQVTTGMFTRQFESAVQEKLQVPHAIMVSSCTSGLMLVLRALELQGEVILPAFTWTATAHAVVWNGLTPVFADITPGSYTLDPQAVEQAITPHTVAVIPVNVFGCPPDYVRFGQLAEKYNVPLIYDSAQGLGSRYRTKNGNWHYSGNFGEAEIFSLSPTKVVSAMEGGLITTHNPDLAQKLRQMRDYGKTLDGEDIEWLGLSARVPEINAIVARHNFARVDELIGRRQEMFSLYQNALGHLTGLTYQKIPSICHSTRNYLTVFIDSNEARYSRDEIYEHLKKCGIQTKKYFYPSLHRQKVYQTLETQNQKNLPVTDAAAAAGLALPFYSHISADTIQEVASCLREILTFPGTKGKMARSRRIFA
jgi:dTDP-4-amino-4,6-dideoxygalactose transaminase